MFPTGPIRNALIESGLRRLRMSLLDNGHSYHADTRKNQTSHTSKPNARIRNIDAE